MIKFSKEVVATLTISASKDEMTQYADVLLGACKLLYAQDEDFDEEACEMLSELEGMFRDD